MDLRPNFTDLTQPNDILELKRIIQELADELDIIYTTTAPDGNISARQGRRALYKNGSVYERWINVDGLTTWQREDIAGTFVTGDWIISSVTTARTGWSNVSATYSNRFMRINATPLTTGGADTHTHGAGSYTVPAHDHGATTGSYTLTVSDIPAHTHVVKFTSSTGGSTTAMEKSLVTDAQENTKTSESTGGGGGHSHTITQQAAATITGTSASGDNVPAYVQVVIFQKD